MDINVAHVVVTALVIFVVVYAAEHVGPLRNASRVKRALVVGGLVFVAMLLLNILWPPAAA